jgi:hypothetical protein
VAERHRMGIKPHQQSAHEGACRILEHVRQVVVGNRLAPVAENRLRAAAGTGCLGSPHSSAPPQAPGNPIWCCNMISLPSRADWSIARQTSSVPSAHSPLWTGGRPATIAP